MKIYEKEKTIVIVSSDKSAVSYSKSDLWLKVDKKRKLVFIVVTETNNTVGTVDVADKLVNAKGKLISVRSINDAATSLAGFLDMATDSRAKKGAKDLNVKGQAIFHSEIIAGRSAIIDKNGQGLSWKNGLKVIEGEKFYDVYTENNPPAQPKKVLEVIDALKGKDLQKNTKARHTHKNAAVLDSIKTGGSKKRVLSESGEYVTLPEQVTNCEKLEGITRSIRGLEKELDKKSDSKDKQPLSKIDSKESEGYLYAKGGKVTTSVIKPASKDTLGGVKMRFEKGTLYISTTSNEA